MIALGFLLALIGLVLFGFPMALLLSLDFLGIIVATYSLKQWFAALVIILIFRIRMKQE